LMQQLRQCRSAPQLVKLLSDATEAGRIPSLDHYHCALQGMVVGTTPENAKGGRRSPRSQPSQPAEEERWSRGRREGVLCAFDLLGLMMRRGARKEDPEARPSSPAPTPKTFTLVLRILVNARRWKQAVDLVQSMEAEYGVAPDIVNYNSALRACAASKQWRAAQDLLQTIRLRAHVSDDDDDDDGGGGEAEAEEEAEAAADETGRG
jgi:pentatricopeptide repeat protein